MRNLKFLGVSFLLAMTAATSGVAQNPIIQTKYTADPTPMVYNDTVFLYTTHDEDDAEGFKMLDWLLYTSTDMVNWTDHGAVASLKSFDWVKRDNGAWAEQVIERNGKFYMYCPIHGNGIGVLVSDSPYGPFKDPLNKPLVWQKEHWYDIDPTVFIDDDGQAYMYWGNPNVYYVKLNEDMISYSGEIVQVENKPEHYQEGPWVYKRNGHYYMAFASTCCPEGIGYAMSDKATGPWSTKGYIMICFIWRLWIIRNAVRSLLQKCIIIRMELLRKFLIGRRRNWNRLKTLILTVEWKLKRWLGDMVLKLKIIRMVVCI